MNNMNVPLNIASTVEFDVETDAGIEQIDRALEELAVSHCPHSRKALAGSLAAALCRSMLMSEQVLYGSLLYSHPG